MERIETKAVRVLAGCASISLRHSITLVIAEENPAVRYELNSRCRRLDWITPAAFPQADLKPESYGTVIFFRSLQFFRNGTLEAVLNKAAQICAEGGKIVNYHADGSGMYAKTIRRLGVTDEALYSRGVMAAQSLLRFRHGFSIDSIVRFESDEDFVRAHALDASPDVTRILARLPRSRRGLEIQDMGLVHIYEPMR